MWVTSDGDTWRAGYEDGYSDGKRDYWSLFGGPVDPAYMAGYRKGQEDARADVDVEG
jgi:hypothetical protein